MKTVMIYAYTRFNFGDDLFIKMLVDRYPRTKFKLYTYPEYKQIFEEYKNLTVYSNANIFAKIINFIGRIFNKSNLYENLLMYTCDACVYIGGSLFIQGYDWRNNLQYTSERMLSGKPFFLIGANFGPYNDSDFFDGYLKLFGKYTDICFRDEYSYRLFKRLKNVRLAPDIVLGYKYEYKVEPQNKVEPPNKVVISVLGLEDKENLQEYEQVYICRVAQLCDRLLQRGSGVTLISFCKLELDEQAIEKIYKLIHPSLLDGVTKIFYRGDIAEVIHQFAQAQAVIATRFHAMILAMVLNKIVYPIVYSEKMLNVINDMGYDCEYTRVQDIKDLDIEKVVDILSKNRNINIQKWHKDSAVQFAKLDEYLI